MRRPSISGGIGTVERRGSILPAAPESIRTLEELICAALEGKTEVPEAVLQDPQLREAAQALEHKLFSAAVRELESKGPDTPLREVLPLLQAFELVRARLAGSSRPAVNGPEAIALRWETLELAHDFRSPLTSILFLTETLRRGQSGPVTSQQHRQLGIIYSAALGMVSMSNDVIGLTHGGEQLMDRNPSAFSLRELFESTVEVVQPIAEDRNLSLRLLIQAPDRRIGHPAVLSRILLNLTTNALKYTDEGMVELIARGSRDNRIELSVRDTGRGLDDETIANLYKPYRRKGPGLRPSLDSHGLGLTICRKLVAAIGSELQYETAPGWGTRFFFEISLPSAPTGE